MVTSSRLSGVPEAANRGLNPTWTERLTLWNAAGYRPSREQLEAHLHPAKYKQIAGGERGGKSYSAAMELIARHHLGTLFWLVGPDYRLCRPEFRYLADFFTKIGAVENLIFPVSEFQPCYLRLKGGTEIQTLTARDAQKLAARAPDGIIGCEAAQLDYEVFLKMFGRLAETDGWMWLSGTFEHDSYLSWYAENFEKWQSENLDNGASFSIPTWANRAIFPGGINDPKIIELRDKSPSEEWFLERYGGVPCPPATAVFKEFKYSTHVTSKANFQPWRLGDDGNPIERNGRKVPWPVEITIDPGYNGAYAVCAIQQDPPFVNVIDEVYRQYMAAPDIIAECKDRPWWQNVRDRGVIDIAGTQHQGLASHVEVWQQLAGIALESAKVEIPIGIARMRTFLKVRPDVGPLLRYSPSCKQSIKEYALYQYKEVSEGKNTSEKPIDAYNHASKAVAYWLVARFGHVDAKPKRTKGRLVYGRKSKESFRAGPSGVRSPNSGWGRTGRKSKNIL